MGRLNTDRSLGLGGSDIGPMLGLSRYRSPLHVYLEKRRELPPEDGRDENAEGKRFGTLCESVVATLYRERTGRTIRKPGRTYRHPQYAFMLANPDRLQQPEAGSALSGRGILEIKWLDASRRWVWINEGVPDGYYLQLQHYLLVTGASWGSFAVVFGGNRLEYFDVQRDEAVIQRLIEVESDFWRRVETGNPPDVSFDALGASLLGRLYPTPTPGAEMILDDEEARAKARRLFSISALLKAREEEKDALEVWFKDKMREAELLLVPSIGKFTWKAQAAKRVDLALLRKEQPEIAARYSVESTTRVFRKQSLEEIAAEMGAEITAPLQAPQAARRLAFDE